MAGRQAGKLPFSYLTSHQRLWRNTELRMEARHVLDNKKCVRKEMFGQRRQYRIL